MLIFCILTTFVSCKKTDSDASLSVSDNESQIIDPSTSKTSEDDTTSKIETETTKANTSTTSPADISGSKEESTKVLALANPNTVLLDAKGVKLTALDFDNQISDTFITINVQVENNNDHDVNIMLNSLSVNGYLISGKLDSFTTKAGANQKVPFTISKRDIEFAEIDEIREILVSFYAKDADYDLFISPTEPVSLKTNKFDTPEKELNTNGVQVYNDNNILIVAKEELSSDSRYMFAKLLIKNSTDSRISVSCTKLLVNGKSITNCNRVRYGNVPGGIISYNSLDIEKSDLKNLGIQDIETIEMTLKIISAENTLIADNLTVTVNYK